MRPGSARRWLERLVPELNSLGGEPTSVILESDRDKFDEVYRVTEELYNYHQLSASRATTRQMRECLKISGSTYKVLYKLAGELEGRLADEMNERTFLSLSLEETEYFNNPSKGWEEIIAQFAGTIGDIEEARKCFALSRYAGTVFHTLHVVEIGVIELGKLIGVNDPLVGWSATNNALQKILKKGYQERTPFEQKNSPFLEQIQGTIQALQSPWRNKVSHAPWQTNCYD